MICLAPKPVLEVIYCLAVADMATHLYLVIFAEIIILEVLGFLVSPAITMAGSRAATACPLGVRKQYLYHLVNE
jgi:hypothetical protein